MTQKCAWAAFFTFLITPLAWAQNTTHDVVIVGAGSAGLYAARNLIDDATTF